MDGGPLFIRFAPRYLWSYLDRSAVILAVQPSVEAVMGKDFVLKDMDMNCLDCPCMIRNDRQEQILEFSRIFGAEIKRAIEQVSIQYI